MAKTNHARKRKAKQSKGANAKPSERPVDGNMRVQVVQTDVPNPYHDPDPIYAGKSGNPSTIRVSINMRESPAALMFYRQRSISKHQYDAATEFRRIWELAGGAGASAMDYTREVVDGGGTPEPISVRRGDAVFRLKELRDVLGADTYAVLERTCGECQFVSHIVSGSRARQRYTDIMKNGMTALAVEFGYIQAAKAA